MKKLVLWTIGIWYVSQALLTHWEQKREKEKARARGLV